MDSAHADARAARAHLLEGGGWQFRRLEPFRFVPPPAAAVWLGPECTPVCASKPGAGWTLQPGSASTLVQAQTFDAADPVQRAALLQDLPAPDDDYAAPFAWAHRALVRQGLKLRVAAGASAAAPLVLQLQHPATAGVEAPLLVLELEPGAHCVLVESHAHETAAGSAAAGAAENAAECVQNLQMHIRVGAGARLQHWRLVRPVAGDRFAHHLDIRVAAGAFYGQAMLAGGSAYHLQRAQVLLQGEGADARLTSVLLANDSQLDRQVRMVHAAPRTVSTARALALAGGRALVAADLYAHVRPGAEDADINQHVAGIPVAGSPRLVMRPQLEIEHDAVKAAHGSTWGRLPDDAIFFARQRGLEKSVALALILRGMALAELERGLGEALAESTGATQAVNEGLAQYLGTGELAAALGTAAGVAHGGTHG